VIAVEKVPANTDFPWPERTYPGKRALDVVLSALLLVLACPAMLAIALAVKLTTSGPVFYRGRRAGLRGRLFEQIKFRSMTVGTPGAAFTSRSDPRVTGVGKLLRFVKLDELPQLFNVLRGEMSIVGPRPEDARVVTRCYSRGQLRVLTVRPGLTGLLQVRVFPDFTYDVPEGVDPERYYQTRILPERIEEDLQYVDRMSLWTDLGIILQTAWCISVKGWIVLWRRRRMGRDAEVAQSKA
jgi:lipopolysaccharide/colanic/teichoic acid biosynthesis glycosyltransferase